VYSAYIFICEDCVVFVIICLEDIEVV
jgi:hypothetical protein